MVVSTWNRRKLVYVALPSTFSVRALRRYPANMDRTTNQTLAGRSARRRMYHANQ
jgi:hypothetical protein